MLVWLTVFFSEDETLHLQAREPSEQCARIVPFSQLQGAWAFQFLKHWNLGDFVLLCLGQISYLPGTGMIISVVSCFMLDCCLSCRMTSGFTQWCTVDKYCGYLKRRQNNFNYFCCNFIGPVVCKKKKKVSVNRRAFRKFYILQVAIKVTVRIIRYIVYTATVFQINFHLSSCSSALWLFLAVLL